ncbi:MAG TPA: DNA repair exonuclease [Candidatus Dorea intestinavium]|nr:DNA repair exonuclease [Candidatus Dorea intestinavium]
MIKFIHIADVHLGAQPDAGKAYENRRARELWESFERVLNLCNEEGIDLLLIAGDLFHAQPLLKELKEVDYLFSKLVKTQVVLIAGNHDHMKGSSFYHSFKWSANVFMIKDPIKETIEIPGLNLLVSGFSYHEREILIPQLKKLPALESSKNQILLLHGGDQKHVPFTKEMLRGLNYDYIALGHIHKPEIVIAGKAAYAGALEPIDRNDVGKHGYIYGELAKGKTKITFVPFAKRSYVNLDIKVNQSMTAYEMKDEVVKEIKELGVNNIFKVRLRGYRQEQISLDLTNFDTMGNIIDLMDDTRPFYNFEKLRKNNQDNIIGKFIEEFIDSDKESIEYEAMIQGITALMEATRI